MNDRLNYWNNMINTYDLDTLAKDLNASWDPISKKYTKHHEIPINILNHLKDKVSSVLDFGCGLGRNLQYLTTTFPYANVLGYDIPSMINKYKQLSMPYEVTDDWSYIEGLKPDLIYSCTVLQHLDLTELVKFLNFAAMNAKYVYLHTRCYNDVARDWRNARGGINVASLFQHKFEIVECSIDINKITSLQDETHYDILYRTK